MGEVVSDWQKHHASEFSQGASLRRDNNLIAKGDTHQENPAESARIIENGFKDKSGKVNDQSNVSQWHKEMADRGVPAIEVIGSQADLAKFAKETLPGLKAQYGDQAIFAAIDKDKVDPHSDLGRLANTTNFSDAYARIVTLNSDKEGNIDGEHVVNAGWGKGINAVAQKEMSSASKSMRDIKTKLKPGATEKNLADSKSLTPQALRESGEKIKAEMAEAKAAGKDVSKFEAHYLTAMAEADKFTMKQLEGEGKRIGEAKKNASGKDLDSLNEEEKLVKSLKDDKFNTRLELGKAFANAGLSEVGKDWVLSAGRRDHAALQSQGDALSKAHFSHADLNYINKGMQSPKWGQMADDAIPERKIEASKKREIQEENKATDLKSDRTKMQEFREDHIPDALRAAKERGLPVLVDIGGGFKKDKNGNEIKENGREIRNPGDCINCFKMDKTTMPKIETDYKDRAVLLKLDANKPESKALLKELGLEKSAWPALLVATVKDDHGQLKLERLSDPSKDRLSPKGLLENAEGFHQGLMDVAETQKFLGSPLRKSERIMEQRFGRPQKQEKAPKPARDNREVFALDNPHKAGHADENEYLTYDSDSIYV